MTETTWNDLIELLETGHAAQASDMILVAGSPPCVYVHGSLRRLEGPVLSDKDIDRLLGTVLGEERREQLKRRRDLDFSLNLPQGGRCRANIHYQRRSLAAAFRYVPDRVPTLEELSLPPVLKALAQLPQGFVLVTGATGQGKSTTLAAMINHVNSSTGKHIITLEDPIEFSFRHGQSLIEQRDIGEDSPSFSCALRHILRQKPEVILVGEMRDQETIATAMTAAETGHLVLGTLHTSSAAGAIERIVDMFEGRQQHQIRVQLAHALEAVVSQVLVEDLEKPGLVPVCEILIATPAVRRAIRDSDTHLVPNMIETGSTHGMQTMDQALVERFRQGRISRQQAVTRLTNMNMIDALDGPQRAVSRTAPPSARPARVGR